MMETIHDLDPDNNPYEEERHMNRLLAEEIKQKDEIISNHISENYTTTKQPMPEYNIDRLIEDIRRQNQLQQAEYNVQKKKEMSMTKKLEEMVEFSDGVFWDMDTGYIVMSYEKYKVLKNSKEKLGIRIDNDAAVKLIIDTYSHVVEAITTIAFVMFLASFFLDWSRTVTLASVIVFLIGSFLPTDKEKLYNVFLKQDTRKK